MCAKIGVPQNSIQDRQLLTCKKWVKNLRAYIQLLINQKILTITFLSV